MKNSKFLHLSRDNCIAIFAIFILIIGLFLGAYFQHNLDNEKIKEQQRNDRKMSAQAFLTEINQIEPLLNVLEPSFEVNQLDLNSPPYVMNQPLYSNTGLYFSMTEDIGKFDKNLSRNLFIFYDNLNRAESNRNRIVEDEIFYRTHPNLEGTNIAEYKNQSLLEAKVLTYEMRARVTNSAKLIPILKEELNTYINSET